MKLFIKITLVLASLFTMASCGNKNVNTNVIANSEANFKVWGNCNMCKETIENALKADGIRTADWSIDSKLMRVAFDSTKISLDEIEKKVAAVGYDTETYQGNDDAYARLPECCQYERKKH